ncbi:ATP-dependent 3'-5' DNA helicase [Rhizina undulata]
MPTLKGKSIGISRPPLKRKQALNPPENPSSEAPKSPTSKSPKPPAPKKPRRAPAKKASAASSATEDVPVSSDIPWPTHFKELEKVHRSLNLVYTFCSTRKHLATTFDNLKSAVEGHTKKELKVDDIAQIKFLVPKSVTFSYVSEDMLQLHVMEASSSTGTRAGLKGEKVEKEDVFKLKDLSPDNSPEVLIFEFIDGDVKPDKNPKSKSKSQAGEWTKAPNFSTAQMTKLITKRNTKFTSAVNSFLNECSRSKVDPVETLKAQYHPHVPVQSDSASTTPAASTTFPREIPKERKLIEEIIEEIKSLDFYSDQIAPDGHRVFPPQEAVYGDLSFPLSQSLVNSLYTAHNIEKLYSHQAKAISYLHSGHNVIVSTSTSSGKSLIYQIPVLHELESNPDARAFFIFPTKALAQDQKRSLLEVLQYMKEALGDVRVDTFDGDTDMGVRREVREEARVIFTNPDMLHLTILPGEEHWRTFLKNLKYVVVDELHVYNGLFGTHVAFIMRRLRRICAALGNHSLKFISCSATVANPEAHMRTIFGLDSVQLVSEDGSPSGLKEFICWNTPLKDPGDPSVGRVDPISESAKVFVNLILRGVRTIAFCRIRKVCEVVLAAVKSELQRMERPEVAGLVMAYRGGYTPQDRRQIEKEMFEGRLMGIVATNALELGVDIGSLDAVIMVGFPYNISNFRQQSGRAGRRNKDSLSVLVGDGFPTDQYYMTHPSELFTKPNAELQLDLSNPLILEGHLQCAAFEMPITPLEDQSYFGADLLTLAEERLVKDHLGFYHCHPRFRPRPSKTVSIRDVEDGHFAVIDVTRGRNKVLEEVEPSRVIFTLYEGGIFLHQGYSYIVKNVSPEKKLCSVELVNVDFTTTPRDYTDIDPIETESIRAILGSPAKAFFGKIRLYSKVFGYWKLDRQKRVLDVCEVDSPPLVRFSKGLWLDVPKSALDILQAKRINLAGAIHSAAHAVLSLLPTYVITGEGDVRTECKAPEKEFMARPTSRKRPARLVFYDVRGGDSGSGVSRKAFEFVDVLMMRAVERIRGCGCREGCVECVASERCKELNAVMSKAGAEVVLLSLLGWEIDLEKVPMGDEEEGRDATIVKAEEVGCAGVGRVQEE